jgi:hypothetical protein
MRKIQNFINKVKDMNIKNEYHGNNYEKLKCIWMASKIIEYKLCDNRFDCDNCMFDKGIKNLLYKKETQVNVLDIISEKLHRVKYDDNIIYLKNNLIVKEICSNTFYLGIDPILNCFLDTVSSFSLNDSEKKIKIGQPLIQISGMWGAVSLSSPVNFLIYDKVNDSTDNSLRFQWYAIIGLEDRELFRGRLSFEEWDNMHERALCIIEEIKSEIPKVGETMKDGGTQIKFLHQLLGIEKYIIILNVLKAQ